MSPAGHWPQLNTAIEAGADAVYFGLHHFSARAKVGFDLAELPQVMRTLHSRGVRGYLTFNTLVFDNELREAARGIEAIANAGVDAIIVQDVGVARLAHQIAPDLEIHGSTQMSITSAEGVEFARQFGIRRVVLARELSLDDIARIRAQTDCELELFVHGALCVSYSGQCFSSEAWGGRSANRGQCAQACRLSYELIVDGRPRPLGDARFLLSPGDLYALPLLPRIIPLGISSLKIEGRYKDANYVALTTAAYRKAVDEAYAGLPLSITDVEQLQLEQVYSRGLGPYFVQGVNHQQVVRGRAPRHRGVYMGTVARIESATGVILVKPGQAHAISPLKPGDGLVFDAADWRSPDEPEEGGRVYQAQPRKDGLLALAFANNALDFSRIRAGDRVWRSDDPDIARLARPFTQAHAPVHKQPVDMRLTARENERLKLTVSLCNHPDVSVTAEGNEPVARANRQPLDAAAARAQLSRLGDTPYELRGLTCELYGQPFVPPSALNALRREAIAALAALQAQPPPRAVAPWAQTLEQMLLMLNRPSHAADGAATQPALHVLVRTPEQLDAALALDQKPESITLDYLELYGLRPAVERIQAASIRARVASPRVLKPDEERVVNFLRKLGCDILVRSSGLLHTLTREGGLEGVSLIGDFSLNTANQLTAAAFLEKNLQRITPTYDLNAAQIAALARRAGSGALEVIAYAHLPVFHTEHCVFCRFLSDGTSYKDCGHPCEKHRIALRDHNGRAHPVLADVGCRNTVFGAEAQEASAHLDALREAGVRHFRLEFVQESGTQTRRVIEAFQQALNGVIDASALGARLRAIAPQGTTEGSLRVPLAG